MKVLVTGARGMVGMAVAACCRAQGDEVFPLDHDGLDITDDDRVRELLESQRPQTIINCAAWTDVDGCELNRERAFEVNARGPQVLAENCRRIEASLVTVSTDYVFDGDKAGFYDQRDDPNPKSVYGAAKLEGERRAQSACARTVVVRSGFIFGTGGRNFLSTVIDRARRGESLQAIGDSFGTPTYAPDLARRLRELAELDLPGTYHVVNSGDGVSYQEFAVAALRAAGVDSGPVGSISMGALARPAPRPVNSRLRCLLSPALGLAPLPPWQDAIRAFAMESERDSLV
ncbi:MAG: dTDP-4-dehydrorhamnose reductase [Blastocatellia bacterium]|nr:dTDP-4-dehydrorhamnose reductase [Blastocatellia bacterium]